MKILIAASNMVHINNFHRPYIEEFKARGHSVYIMANGEGADFNIEFEKSTISFKNLKLSYKIRDIIKQERFDIIYLHTTLAAFWVRMALRGVKNRPYVVNTVHGYLFGENSSKVHNTLYLSCEKLLRNQTDEIVVMNKEDYNIAKDNKLCRGNIYFINGMGVNFKDVTEEISMGQKGKISLAFVGEISKRKNQIFLVKSMKQLTSYTLTLVGDGDARDEIEEYIAKEGLSDRVFITGFTKQAYEYVKGCDIYVSASNIEGLPFNIMEAMYLKKPIVASNIKGHCDLLEGGQLFPPNNMEEYVRLVKNTTIGERAYDIERYRLQSTLEENMSIYLSNEKQPSVAK
ncbi:MAG: glycosyltransferase [Clostridia bacterium]|nr:glycosyltransferase [Clostridia bacterium]